MTDPKESTIYVVSDGRGDTCNQLVRAALVQFQGQRHKLVRRAEVRSPQRVEEILHQAAEEHAVVFYTLVADDTREAMKATSEKLLVPTVDVLGPSFSALHDVSWVGTLKQAFFNVACDDTGQQILVDACSVRR